MSGLLSLNKYGWLAPNSGLDPVLLHHYLRVAQSVVEGVTGLIFGSEVASAEDRGGGVWRLTFYGGNYSVGDQVQLIGGGVSMEVFTVLDAGLASIDQADAGSFFDSFFDANPNASSVLTGAAWIDVQSDVAIAPLKILPVIEYVGDPHSLVVECHPRPIFRVVSVKARSGESLWSDTDGVLTLEDGQYELESTQGVKSGVRLKRSAIPLTPDGGDYLIKRMYRKRPDSIKVTYAAGFYMQIPADLEGAASQLTAAIIGAGEDGGVFASESMDYYSYSTLSYDQLAVMPHAAMAILRRYSRL